MNFRSSPDEKNKLNDIPKSVVFAARTKEQADECKNKILLIGLLEPEQCLSMTLSQALSYIYENLCSILVLSSELIKNDQARLLWIQEQVDNAPSKPILVQCDFDALFKNQELALLLGVFINQTLTRS